MAAADPRAYHPVGIALSKARAAAALLHVTTASRLLRSVRL